jgi:thermosome
MYAGQQPIIVLKEGTTREKGKGAQGSNIAAARAIADAVRTTLGPKGMDKMLVDSMGDVVITNDGVTILKEIEVQHPAAKMIVEVAKTQDQECRDGTTTAVTLAGELLKEAESLIDQKVHPTIINKGFGLATEKACKVLEDISRKVTYEDEKTLKSVAETSLTGKVSSAFKEMLSDIALRACKAVAEPYNGGHRVDLDNIKIEKKQGGSVEDTELIEGIILDKERVHPDMPKLVKDAKILLADQALEVKKTEVDAKIQITDPSQLQKYLDQEEQVLKDFVEKVKKTGANVLICQKGIDDLAQYYLSKAGIYAVRRAKKSDMEALSKAINARIITNLKEASAKDLGKAKVAEEKKIGDDKMTFITGCPKAKAVSVLIRGGTEHIVDEVERGVHDAIGVIGLSIEDGKVITGGGSSAIEIALALRDYAPTIGGREQMAVEAFANATEVVPRALAENAGLDAIEMLINLRKAHREGKKWTGINVVKGNIEDMKKNMVLESLKMNTHAIRSASEAAIMILRIDDVISAKAPEKGVGAPPGGMPPGGPGGYGGPEEY